MHLIAQISARTNIQTFEMYKSPPLALAGGGWRVSLCTWVALRWWALFVLVAGQLQSPQQLELFLSSKAAPVFDLWYPTTAWFSSQRKDDPGERSPLSRRPKRWSRRRRRRRGRGREVEVGSPAPCQLHLGSFEALNNLDNSSEGWNKRWQGKLIETNMIFLPFLFFFLHMRKGRLWLAVSGVTHCDRKNPHQATACLLVRWLRCCPPPSLPYFAPEPTWQTLCWSILKLFLVSFWYRP